MKREVFSILILKMPKQKLNITIKTTARQVAEHLKKAILTGGFMPGSKLKENEMSELFNLSRTPIREAFRILEAEGLVEIKANKGVRVTLITIEDVNEVYELRFLLELYCIKIFVKFVNASNFRDLEDILEKMESAVNRKDYASYLAISIDFHGYYVKNCQNKRMFEIFSNMKNTIRLAHVFLDKNQNYYKKSLFEHKNILKAIKEKDQRKCENLLQQHLEASCEIMKRNLSRIKAYANQM